MARKRTTRQQREAAQLAALEQRLHDIYSGALGRAWGDDEFATADTLSRIVPVCEDLFVVHEEGRINSYLFRPHNLEHYDTPATAARFLYEHGVRA